MFMIITIMMEDKVIIEDIMVLIMDIIMQDIMTIIMDMIIHITIIAINLIIEKLLLSFFKSSKFFVIVKIPHILFRDYRHSQNSFFSSLTCLFLMIYIWHKIFNNSFVYFKFNNIMM